MGKIVITHLLDKEMLFLFDDEHELQYIKCISDSLVGNIYVGKIREINRSLNGAFAAIAPKKKVFLPLAELPDTVKCGDELPIQIKTDAIKTKLPQGTTQLALAGEYCVCHLTGAGISISKKLDEYTANELIQGLRTLQNDRLRDFKWVIRTNSASLLAADMEPLYREIDRFRELGTALRKHASSRTCYSVLYEGSDGISGVIRDIPSDQYDHIITDNKGFYDTLRELELCRDKDIRLYTESNVSLKNLYSLETHLNRLLEKKVYLHSGGHLVIEQTEAMNVIDVNTGRADGRRHDAKSFIRRINTEAAHEIARQIRLRNLSGIIMVDFISMRDQSDGKELLELLNSLLSKDHTPCRAVDMTALGIVEITRKKLNLSLLEEFGASEKGKPVIK